jgi:uncharacterized cupin superfamily protein
MPLKPPAFDPKDIAPRVGITAYPEKYRGPVAGRARRALGDPHGLTQFGVNLTTIPPGGWSAQRHWHAKEDEFVYVVAGELVLITNGGEQVLGPGMAAAFPAGKADGHHLVNRTDRDATYLEVGTRHSDERVEYPECDMRVEPGPDGKRRFVNRKGEPY